MGVCVVSVLPGYEGRARALGAVVKTLIGFPLPSGMGSSPDSTSHASFMNAAQVSGSMWETGMEFQSPDSTEPSSGSSGSEATDGRSLCLCF